MENMSLINLREAELVETPAEGATLFCLNPDGTVNRVSAANVGGSGGIKTAIIKDSGGIKTAIIKDSGYDNAIAGVQSASSSTPEYTYECINMTFEEASQIMASGDPLQVLGMVTTDGGTCAYGAPVFAGTAMGVECITIIFKVPYTTDSLTLYWTAAGLSTSAPGA